MSKEVLVTGNVVMTGDYLYAGVEEEDVTPVTNAVVIRFETDEDLRQALRDGKTVLTIFGEEDYG